MQTATLPSRIKESAESLRMNGRIIDLKSLRELSGNDDSFIHEILGMFKKSATQQVDEMLTSIDKGAMDILGASAHRFKSSVSILGNSNLYELVADIEYKAKHDGDVNELKENVLALKYVTELAEEEIEEHLSAA